MKREKRGNWQLGPPILFWSIWRELNRRSFDGVKSLETSLNPFLNFVEKFEYIDV